MYQGTILKVTFPTESTLLVERIKKPFHEPAIYLPKRLPKPETLDVSICTHKLIVNGNKFLFTDSGMVINLDESK